jgi:Flp pilus assembly pilin Flp
VEYGLFLAAVAAVLVAVIFGLGAFIDKTFEDSSQCLASRGASGPNC